MKYLSTTVAFLIASAVAGTSQETLLEFDIGNLEFDPPGSLAPSFTAPNMSGGDLSRQGVDHDPFFGDGEENVAADSDGLYGAGEWPADSSADAEKYFEFSLTPDENFSLTVDSLQLGLFTENTQDVDPDDGSINEFLGPRLWDVSYSLDGFTTVGTVLDTLETPLPEDVPAGESRWAQYTFTLTDLAIVGTLGQTITFRVAGYDRPEGSDSRSYGGFSNATGDAPSLGFPSSWEGQGANITASGTVIPEPSQVAASIAGLAFLVTVLVRRLRRKA